MQQTSTDPRRPSSGAAVGYTAGPWAVVSGKLGKQPAGIYSEPAAEMICELVMDPDDPYRYEPDARLIAAAPELYEALRGLMDAVYAHDDHGDGAGLNRSLSHAARTLAKARGEAV